MDALRNLIVQSFLIEKPEFGGRILNNGFCTALEQIIEKSINQL